MAVASRHLPKKTASNHRAIAGTVMGENDQTRNILKDDITVPVEPTVEIEMQFATFFRLYLKGNSNKKQAQT